MLTVLLDLDHTLIESIELEKLVLKNKNIVKCIEGNLPEHKPSAKKLAQSIAMFEWYNIPGYVVCIRPHVKTLIKTLYSNGYNVGIWTAADKTYARDIIAILDLTYYPIKYLLFDIHDNTGTKPLKNIFGNDLSHVFIIDDNDHVHKSQNKNCFHIKPFYVEEYNSHTDIELLRACNFLARKTYTL